MLCIWIICRNVEGLLECRRRLWEAAGQAVQVAPSGHWTAFSAASVRIADDPSVWLEVILWRCLEQFPEFHSSQLRHVWTTIRPIGCPSDRLFCQSWRLTSSRVAEMLDSRTCRCQHRRRCSSVQRENGWTLTEGTLAMLPPLQMKSSSVTSVLSLLRTFEPCHSTLHRSKIGCDEDFELGRCVVLLAIVDHQPSAKYCAWLPVQELPVFSASLPQGPRQPGVV